MLKDIVKNLAKKKINGTLNISDSIKNNFCDGFVDIKAYRNDIMEYHDAGDNVVTDWMRHAILILLTGDSFSKLGNVDPVTKEPINTIDPVNHFRDIGSPLTYFNKDGYMLNGQQYFWDPTKYYGHYSKTDVNDTTINNIFSLFPTKVLFGTGKEYASWSDLYSDTFTSYNNYYTNMLDLYGAGNETTAATSFNGEPSGSLATIAATINHYSSTLESATYSGNSLLKKTRTVNDPSSDNTKVTNPSSSLNIEYGITGAIKTPYFDKTADIDKLAATTTEQGKLLKPTWAGVGRPAFIYFNTPEKKATVGRSESWADPESGAEIILTRDSTKKYLEKVTFTITMPDQTATNAGEFYPYNGYTLRQIGLFNDSRMSYSDDPANILSDAEAYYQYKNMPCGMMLAKKHITPFQKTADLKIVLSWVLSI